MSRVEMPTLGAVFWAPQIAGNLLETVTALMRSTSGIGIATSQLPCPVSSEDGETEA